MGSQLDYYQFMGYPSAELMRRYTPYAERFARGSTVLDIGFGRGEFLKLLAERGVLGQGIDQDQAMVQFGRDEGLSVEVADAHEYLAHHEDHFDGIFAAHLIEHMSAEQMQELVHSAVSALRPGGRLLLVTPSPHNLNVQLYEFWTDLQHVRFYTPDILSWVLHDNGLREVETGDNPIYTSGPEMPTGGAGAPAPPRSPQQLRLRARARQRLAEWLTPASVLERTADLEQRTGDLAAMVDILRDRIAALYPAGEFFATGVRLSGCDRDHQDVNIGDEEPAVTTFANPAETKKRKRMARWLSGSGIEIGALHYPLSVPADADVRYVDRFEETQLREHYPELAELPLVPVSLIGSAQDLSALSDDSVDFVIANHLFEHLDNPIRGLQEMFRVLRAGGVLYLALPEPRATFDSKRDLTTVEHLVRDYRSGPEQSRDGHFTEWVEKVEMFIDGGHVDDVPARVRQLSEMDYSIHYHVWRPDTFMDFLSAAREVTGIELELVDFAPCDHGKDNEFIFVFLKGNAGTPPAIPPLPGEALDEPVVP
jgi:SAM-dependent methyltransferase